MINELSLTTGIDIPFPEAKLIMHQPRINEIALIGGEEIFFTGCNFLNFSKEFFLEEKDRFNLAHLTNFEVFMSIVKNKDIAGARNRICALRVLTLFFPNYEMRFGLNEIIFKMPNSLDELYINKDNFEIFKQMIVQVCCLDKLFDNKQDYNPQGDLAKKLAEKFKKRHQILSQKNQNLDKDKSIFSQYMSILAVGESRDINSFSNYTIYQLLIEFQRFTMKENYDTYIQAKLAGGQNLKEVDYWMKEITNKEKTT